jgi:hypothetical protein
MQQNLEYQAITVAIWMVGHQIWWPYELWVCGTCNRGALLWPTIYVFKFC